MGLKDDIKCISATDIAGHLDSANKAVDYLNLEAAKARVEFGVSSTMIDVYNRLRDTQQAIDSAKQSAKGATLALAKILEGH